MSVPLHLSARAATMARPRWRERMAYWLVKSEPETFSWDEQVQLGAKGSDWTGVRNHQAKIHLMAMKKGDAALFYHSGGEKAVVGIVEITKPAYPDPTDETGKFVCVDVKARGPMKTPVTLAAIKAEPALKDMVLVKNSRLSVQPVTVAEWKTVCAMGGVKA
jgi:predicted RNA-binding protein with PUA-like domain